MKIHYLFIIIFICSCQNEEIQHLKSEIYDLKNEIRELEQLKYEVSQIKKVDKKNWNNKAKNIVKKELAKKPTPLKNSAVKLIAFSKSQNELDDPFLGDENNQNVIMIFSNFESKLSYSFFKKNLDKIKKEYINTNKFKLIFRDFPLNIHSRSKYAANIANCLLEQNKYWEIFPILYNNQDLLGSQDYQGITEQISGLNQTQLKECIKNKSYFSEIELDKLDGDNIGVKGTPNIFIGKLKDNNYNGYLIRGAQPYDVIEQYLKKF